MFGVYHAIGKGCKRVVRGQHSDNSNMLSESEIQPNRGEFLYKLPSIVAQSSVPRTVDEVGLELMVPWSAGIGSTSSCFWRFRMWAQGLGLELGLYGFNVFKACLA